MIHCGGNVWECFNGEKEGGIDYMYLSINASPSLAIFVTYILFLTKMQKGKSSEMDLPLLKNDITRFFIDVILVFYCSNM